MKPSSIIDIINLSIFIGKLLIEYGPKLYKMGVDIYEAVEKWAEGRKETGHKVPSEEKVVRFDSAAKTVLLAANRPTGPTDLSNYRENIWLSRKDNWTKQKRLSRTPGGSKGVVV